MTDIIIVTHNNLASTAITISSVWEHTPEGSYRLIIVDNGSTDDTKEYLEQLAKSHQATVLLCRENMGFAAATNLGLSLTRSQWIVLLNNDVIVTDGWLDRLTSGHNYDLAGPTTNIGPPHQRIVNVEQIYTMESQMHEFAEMWAETNRGKSQQVQKLSGFCLAVSRPVLDKLGGFDIQFFPGCFEDDDYCVRAAMAGFTCGVIRDCFIHHVGGVTFNSLGEQALNKALLANWQRFKEKWGIDSQLAYGATYTIDLSAPEAQEHVAFPLPDLLNKGKVVARRIELDGQTAPETWPSVSLCMIGRDEDRNLQAAILPFYSLLKDAEGRWRPGCEIIFVDTGSADSTVIVAEDLGCKIRTFTWIDDFAAARNQSIQGAVGDWILWHDADDRISEEDVTKIKQALASGTADAYAFQISSIIAGVEGKSLSVTQHIRLFRNHPEIRFAGRIHEDVATSLLNLGYSLLETNVEIDHVGYATDVDALRKRALRNEPLVELELQENPDDPRWMYYRAQCHHTLQWWPGAVELTTKLLENGHRFLSASQEYGCHLLHITGLYHLGEFSKAAEHLNECLTRYPNNRHLLILAALMLRDHDAQQALELLEIAEPLPAWPLRQWPSGTIERERALIQERLNQEV